MSNSHGVHGSEIINAVILQLGVELTRRTANPSDRRRALSGDEAVIDKALHAACATLGLTHEDYRRAIASDPSLMQLERATIDEALSGTADPGPHDAISRESPSGTSANTHLDGAPTARG